MNAATARHAGGWGINFPRLTPDQQAIVEANLGLVGWMVGRMRVPDDAHDDAMQDGTLGLMRAAQLFDPDRGYKFSTFAAHQIRAGIQKGHGRYEGLNWRRAEREGWLDEYEHPVSLDTPFGPDGNLSFIDAITDDTEPDRTDEHRQVLASLRAFALGCCKDRIDRAVVVNLFDLSERLSAAELGRQLGYCGQTIINRQKRIMRILSRYAERVAA